MGAHASRTATTDRVAVADSVSAAFLQDLDGIDALMSTQLRFGNAAAKDLLQQQQPFTDTERSLSLDLFADEVYAEATRRLQTSVDNLGVWRAYVVSELSDLALQAQVFATYALDLRSTAAEQGQSTVYQSWLTEACTPLQGAYESIIEQDRGGCQSCHTVVPAAAMCQRTGDDGVAPVDRVGEAAGIEPDLLAYIELMGSGPTDWYGTLASQFGGSAGSWSSEDAFLLAACALIEPVLAPLGASGYRVLPEQLFSRLGGAPPEELRAEIGRHIDDRVAGFLELIGEIGARAVDWKLFEPVVQDLLAQRGDDRLAAEVGAAYERERVQQTLLAIGLTIAEVVSVVVFPPSAVVWGAVNVAQGAQAMAVGDALADGEGAPDVVAPEAAESGDAMASLGMFQIGMGLTDIGQGVFAFSRLPSGPAAANHDLLLAAGGGGLSRRGSVTIEALPDGRMVVRNLDHPELVMHLDGTDYRLFRDLGNGTLALVDEGVADLATSTFTSRGATGTSSGPAVVGHDVPRDVVPVLQGAGVDVVALPETAVALVSRASAGFASGDPLGAAVLLDAAGLPAVEVAVIRTTLALRHGYPLDEILGMWGPLPPAVAARLGLSAQDLTVSQGDPEWDQVVAVLEAFDPWADPAVAAMVQAHPWLGQIHASGEGRSLAVSVRRPDAGNATLSDFFAVWLPDTGGTSVVIPRFGGELSTELGIGFSHELGHALDGASFVETYLVGRGQQGVWDALIGEGVSGADLALVYQVVDAYHAGAFAGGPTGEGGRQELAAWAHSLPFAIQGHGEEAALRVRDGALESYGRAPPTDE